MMPNYIAIITFLNSVNDNIKLNKLNKLSIRSLDILNHYKTLHKIIIPITLYRLIRKYNSNQACPNMVLKNYSV